MSKYNNIYNWMLTTRKSTDALIHMLKSSGDMKENIDFFMDARFGKKKVEVPSYLILEQEKIKKQISESKDRWISFSAPTSFGKTKILIDLLKNNMEKKIIIAPTLSLCNEYFFNFQKIGLSISTSYLGPEKNIYVLTPEKANLLFKSKPQITFSLAIFDEFYEAFGESRYFTFKKTFDYLQSHSDKIITISPQSVNCSYMNKESRYTEIKTPISATSRIINSMNINIHSQENRVEVIHRAHFEEFQKEQIDEGFLINKWDLDTKQIELKNQKEKNKAKIFGVGNWIFQYFFKKNKKTMVFTELSKIFKYVNFFNDILLQEKTIFKNGEYFFIDKILLYLEKKSPNTKLKLLIENRIGYHHGKMDKYLRFLIECAYREGEITLLMCTTTLSKGINLSPEFLIVDWSPKRKGGELLNEQKIDYINTIGRAGRMTQNMFIGNVFIFWQTKDEKVKIQELTDRTKELVLKPPANIMDAKITNFTSATLSLSKNEDKYLTKIVPSNDSLFLKNIVNKNIDNNKAGILIGLISSFFEIEWYGNTALHWRKYVVASINKMGYTSIYLSEIEEKVIDNDKTLSNVINDFDKEINFNFKKLLVFVAERCFSQGLLTKDELSFFSEDEEDPNNYNPNWPGCFSLVFSQKSCTEDELNEILQKAKESFETK